VPGFRRSITCKWITFSFITSFFQAAPVLEDPRERSRYSDWLWSKRPRGWNLSPSTGKTFLLYTSSTPVLGPTPPPIQRVLRALSLEVKQLGCEADHSSQSSVEARNGGAIPTLPHTS
jgi:hypothetical protein